MGNQTVVIGTICKMRIIWKGPLINITWQLVDKILGQLMRFMGIVTRCLFMRRPGSRVPPVHTVVNTKNICRRHELPGLMRGHTLNDCQGDPLNYKIIFSEL